MLNQVSYLNKERKRKKNYINFSKKFVEREREREREVFLLIETWVRSNKVKE